VHKLYGETVGKLFEKLYNEKIWRKGETAMALILSDMVRPTLNEVMVRETTRGNVFDWDEPGLKPGSRSVEEVEALVREAVVQGVQSIKRHRLMGQYAEAEVVLDVPYRGHTLAGRADFIIQRIRPHNDLVIIDGKGSYWRGKYVDARQLRWYAMLYRLKKGRLPDRLGFLYWRNTPEESVDWIGLEPDKIDDLLQAAKEAIQQIEAAGKSLREGGVPSLIFWATPGSDCRRCSYRPLCSEGSKALSDDTKAQIVEDRKRGVEEGDVSF
jgi:hypothetical protein